MRTTNRGHISDQRLDDLGAAVGDPSAAENAHFASCSDCSRRLQLNRTLDRSLRGRWELKTFQANNAPRFQLSARSLATATASLSIVALVAGGLVYALLRTPAPLIAGLPSASPYPVPSSSAAVSAAPESQAPSTTPAPSVTLSAAPSPVGSSTPTASIVASPSIPAVQSPGSPVTLPAIQGFEGWAPDGEHMLFDKDGDVYVAGSDGSNQVQIPGSAGYVTWIDATTLASLVGDDPALAIGRVSFYDVLANRTGGVEPEFDRIITSLNGGVLAGSLPAAGNVAERSYQVWINGSLSDPRPGEPLAWANDGSKLAVLMPTGPAPGAGGDQGTIALVDASGQTTAQVPGWIAVTFDVYRFSPDGRYLAACLAEPDKPMQAPAIHVIDTTDGSVSSSVGSDCRWNGVGWGAATTLYVSSEGSGSPVSWTPDTGAESLSLGKQEIVSPALNGNLAVWSDTRLDGITLNVGGQQTTYPMPAITDVRWSPIGDRIAVVSQSSDSGVTDLVLLAP